MGRKISKVLIENFQSHSFTEVDFGNFNAIVGPSDNGKTSIIRAIIWALYNNPSGDSFVRKGETKCQVTVLFDDGASIVKTRTPKSHSYDLSENGSEPLHLEAFGVGPVDEVVAFHRMGFVDLFGERKALNICEQLEQPFFLGESPATKALIIGKLGNTEVIDKAIKNNASETRELKAEQKAYKNTLKDVKSELKDLKNLDKIDKAIEIAKVKLEKVKILESKSQNIMALSQKIDERVKKVESLTNLIDVDKRMDNVIDSLDEALDCEDKLLKIKALNDKIRVNEQRLESLKEASNVDIDEVVAIISSLDDCLGMAKDTEIIKRTKTKITQLESNLDRIRKLASKYDDVQGLSSQIDEAMRVVSIVNSMYSVKEKIDTLRARETKGQNIINNLDVAYKSAVNEYKKALTENKKCPLCMQQLSEDKLDGVEEYI